MTQIRRSQFITTYGPGAILEGPHGPRMIPSLEYSGLFDHRSPTQFEITDRRLSKALLDGAGIVRIPSNAELGKPEAEWIYRTKPFPQWSLCTRHGILYKGKDCPRCRDENREEPNWDKANREAVRFVRACPAGHLDDVDWSGMINHTRQNCNPSYLLWMGGGGSLRNIQIQCPICGTSVNLGHAYSRDWQCSGRFPEQESGYDAYRPGNCSHASRIVQRGASNLRIAEIVTSLTIPESDTVLHRILERSPIYDVLVATPPSSKDELITMLQRLVGRGRLASSVIDDINSFDDQTVTNAIADVLQDLPDDPFELRNQELTALKNAASHGRTIPPNAPGYPPQFEVIQNQVHIITTATGRRLRITPVNRLRVVMVQKGYRRAPAGNLMDSELVPVSFEKDGRVWYPGVELFGEGIFVDLPPGERLQLQGPETERWLHAWNHPSEYTISAISLQDFNRHQFHPEFVWWHTLSHRLINALSIDSGYSSAAIRERVYIDFDEQSGETTGGVLLFTSQPGGDGTLGGLIALVPEFERVLENALQDIDVCSNDPLCGEEHFGQGKYNGAACYACTLISETSCEHRNMRLDRNLLLENMP